MATRNIICIVQDMSFYFFLLEGSYMKSILALRMSNVRAIQLASQGYFLPSLSFLRADTNILPGTSILQENHKGLSPLAPSIPPKNSLLQGTFPSVTALPNTFSETSYNPHTAAITWISDVNSMIFGKKKFRLIRSPARS